MLGLVYSALGIMALLILVLAVYGCWRMQRSGGATQLDRESREIFDYHESEGTPTDFFPGKGPPPSEYLL